jgi:hypothetical protein
VTYAYDPTARAACFSAPLCQVSCAPAASLVEGLLACAKTEGGYFWLFGSSYIQVHGIQSGRCVYDVGLEMEGSYKYVRCSAALPVQAWSGLSFHAETGGTVGSGDLSTGLEGCTTVLTCGANGCADGDGGSTDAGAIATAPGCATAPSPNGC